MYKRFSVSPSTARSYMDLFVNRFEYGVQAYKPRENGACPYQLAKFWPSEEPRKLDVSIVRAHLNGDITISLFAIDPATQRSKWIAVDADYTDALKHLAAVKRELKNDGIEAALEQSRRGGHLWVFAENPVLAAMCRVYVYNLALRLGLPVKGGKVVEGLEVFPRQDTLKAGEYGFAIRAPLGVHRKTNKRYWFYEAACNPESQLEYVSRLKKVTEDQLQTLTQGMTLPSAYQPEPIAPYIPRVPRPDTEIFEILKYVEINPRVRESRNWAARCPSCARMGRDRTGDNLKIKKANPLVYHCMAGCDKYAIREALGRSIPVSRSGKGEYFNGAR